jgi:hypothetical protein
MTPAGLEGLLRIALPPLRLALRERVLCVRYVQVRRGDRVAALVAAEELATVERLRARLAPRGWWD